MVEQQVIKEPKTHVFIIVDIIEMKFYMTPYKHAVARFIKMPMSTMYRRIKITPNFLERFTYRNFVITKAKKIPHARVPKQ